MLGSGKTTLIRRLRDILNIDAVDTDDFFDATYAEFRSNPDFIEKTKHMDITEYPGFEERVQQRFLSWLTSVTSHIHVMAGLSLPFAERFTTDYVLLDVDPDQANQRLLQREAQTIQEKKYLIDSIIKESPKHLVQHDLVFTAKVRVGILLPHTFNANLMAEYVEEFPNARKLDADHIFSEIASLILSRP